MSGARPLWSTSTCHRRAPEAVRAGRPALAAHSPFCISVLASSAAVSRVRSLLSLISRLIVISPGHHTLRLLSLPLCQSRCRPPGRAAAAPSSLAPPPCAASARAARPADTIRHTLPRARRVRRRPPAAHENSRKPGQDSSPALLAGPGSRAATQAGSTDAAEEGRRRRRRRWPGAGPAALERRGGRPAAGRRSQLDTAGGRRAGGDGEAARPARRRSAALLYITLYNAPLSTGQDLASVTKWLFSTALPCHRRRPPFLFRSPNYAPVI